MLFALVYLLLRRLLQLVGGSSDRLNNDVELVVLRHQLIVLKRQVGRPHLRRCDLWGSKTRFSRLIDAGR